MQLPLLLFILSVLQLPHPAVPPFRFPVPTSLCHSFPSYSSHRQLPIFLLSVFQLPRPSVPPLLSPVHPSLCPSSFQPFCSFYPFYSSPSLCPSSPFSSSPVLLSLLSVYPVPPTLCPSFTSFCPSSPFSSSHFPLSLLSVLQFPCASVPRLRYPVPMTFCHSFPSYSSHRHLPIFLLPVVQLPLLLFLLSVLQFQSPSVPSLRSPVHTSLCPSSLFYSSDVPISLLPVP